MIDFASTFLLASESTSLDHGSLSSFRVALWAGIGISSWGSFLDVSTDGCWEVGSAAPGFGFSKTRSEFGKIEMLIP